MREPPFIWRVMSPWRSFSFDLIDAPPSPYPFLYSDFLVTQGQRCIAGVSTLPRVCARAWLGGVVTTQRVFVCTRMHVNAPTMPHHETALYACEQAKQKAMAATARKTKKGSHNCISPRQGFVHVWWCPFFSGRFSAPSSVASLLCCCGVRCLLLVMLSSS